MKKGGYSGRNQSGHEAHQTLALGSGYRTRSTARQAAKPPPRYTAVCKTSRKLFPDWTDDELESSHRSTESSEDGPSEGSEPDASIQDNEEFLTETSEPETVPEVSESAVGTPEDEDGSVVDEEDEDREMSEDEAESYNTEDEAVAGEVSPHFLLPLPRFRECTSHRLIARAVNLV